MFGIIIESPWDAVGTKIFFCSRKLETHIQSIDNRVAKSTIRECYCVSTTAVPTGAQCYVVQYFIKAICERTKPYLKHFLADSFPLEFPKAREGPICSCQSRGPKLPHEHYFLAGTVAKKRRKKKLLNVFTRIRHVSMCCSTFTHSCTYNEKCFKIYCHINYIKTQYKLIITNNCR